jgi:hypothetical protein
MNIFGKSLSDYVRFERGFLILILVLVVGVARLVPWRRWSYRLYSGPLGA